MEISDIGNYTKHEFVDFVPIAGAVVYLNRLTDYIIESDNPDLKYELEKRTNRFWIYNIGSTILMAVVVTLLSSYVHQNSNKNASEIVAQSLTIDTLINDPNIVKSLDVSVVK